MFNSIFPEENSMTDLIQRLSGEFTMAKLSNVLLQKEAVGGTMTLNVLSVEYNV